MQMYHLFRNLLKVWSTDFGTAVLYGSDQKSISYAELADMIRNAESEIRLSGIRSELIVTDHEPATLIRIFACVTSGCDVILTDENMPDETLFALARMADAESIPVWLTRRAFTRPIPTFRRSSVKRADARLGGIRQVMKTLMRAASFSSHRERPAAPELSSSHRRAFFAAASADKACSRADRVISFCHCSRSPMSSVLSVQCCGG